MLDPSKFGSDYFSGIANILEMLGFVLTIVGFSFSLMFAYRSKTAAEQARDAAIKAQHRITDMERFGDLETAIAVLEETMRLLRQHAFDIAVDRLTIVKRELSRIRSGTNNLTESDMSIVQNTIAKVSTIMTSIETGKQKQTKPIDVARINSVLSDEIGHLSGLKTKLISDLSKVQHG